MNCAKIIASPACVVSCVQDYSRADHKDTLHHGCHGNGGAGDSEAPSIHIGAAHRELSLGTITAGPDPAYGGQGGTIGSAGQGEWSWGEELRTAHW